jgi:hypothetical protein
MAVRMATSVNNVRICWTASYSTKAAVMTV